MTETRTIQTWPGGQSFEYRGDPFGPADQRTLRAGHRSHEEREAWRPGTADEWRTIRIELRAERYADREVLACQSSLVDDLIKEDRDGFTVDDLINLTTDASDWDADRCRSWLGDRGIEWPDRPEEDTPYVVRALAEPSYAAALEADPDSHEGQCWAAYREADDDDSPRGHLTALRDTVNGESEQAEVYEWWLVSSWLCGQLKQSGEVVIDNDYGYWWGRTCTGQGFIMDGTLQDIAARYEQGEA